jgi:multidrug efflux pump subunit AcrB
MLFSMAVAFVGTPWAAYHILGQGTGEAKSRLGKWLLLLFPPAEHKEGDGEEGAATRLYRRVMHGLIRNTRARWFFLAGMLLLFMGAVSLFYVRAVRVKMLPFDNKSEFQVIVNMPEGTPLEQTARVAQAIGDSLGQAPEVTDYQLYVGASAPYNFNGLVRHYFLRREPHSADIQVNLTSKHERAAQSHDIARRVRPRIQEIARRFGARVQVAEIPPGPPVLQTLVAEIYGPRQERQIDLARDVMRIFEETPGVVDVDWYVEAPQPKFQIAIDKEKAALSGISSDQIVQALQIALGGAKVGLLHLPREKEDVPLLVRLPREARSSVEDLRALKLASPSGKMIPISELVQVSETVERPFIYRKNMKDVVYVTGDVAGEEESPVYAILKLNQALDGLRIPEGYPVERYVASQPFSTEKLSLKWDGEWQITYEVFRDLGMAFAAVLVLIYLLVVGWFQSFKTPLVILAPIPLSLVGILPAHWAMGAFFTATSMIGFIAGAGIVVRNSIILVDFIELRRRQGMPLAEAVVDAGAVRFRPMLLTASAVVVGAAVILFDPIFQGLAISLMAGEVAATLLSRMAVPILYYMSERKEEENMSPDPEPRPALTAA